MNQSTEASDTPTRAVKKKRIYKKRIYTDAQLADRKAYRSGQKEKKAAYDKAYRKNNAKRLNDGRVAYYSKNKGI